MKLIYGEIYTEYDYCIPMIELNYNEEEKLETLNALSITEEEMGYEYTAHLNFNYGLFDSLTDTTLLRLNSILELYNKLFNNDYINRKIWKPFLFTTDIDIAPIKKKTYIHTSNVKNKMKEYNVLNHNLISCYYLNEDIYTNGVKNNYDIKDIPKLQSKEYNLLRDNFLNYQNTKSIKLKNQFNELHKPSNVNINIVNAMNYGFGNSYISLNYEMIIDNELSLLYSFLDCLFSSEYNYSIKRCARCHNFFIATKTDTLYCNRPINDNLTCANMETKIRKQYDKLSNIKRLELKINSLYNSPYISYEDKEKYLLEKKEKKIEYSNDEVSLKNWYLSHYKTEEARKRNDYDID